MAGPIHIEFVDPVDEAKVRSKLIKRIAEAHRNLDFYRKVYLVVAAHEGQSITKRLKGWLEKKFPGYNVSYQDDIGQYWVIIWGNGLKYDEGVRFFLGYSGDRISLSKFTENHPWYAQEGERAKKMQELVDHPEQLQEQVNAWNEHLAAMQKIHAWSEGFDIGSIFEVRD